MAATRAAPIGDPLLQKCRENANTRLRWFPVRDQERLTEKLGHYSDMQSMIGEDTLTWSVFGCAQKEGWINDLPAEAFGPAERPMTWNVHSGRGFPTQ